jgi:hypothetical protein
MKDKEKHPWMYNTLEYDYSPNGVLFLKIKNDDVWNTRKTWSDGKIQRLEDCLNSFVGGLIKTAEAPYGTGASKGKGKSLNGRKEGVSKKNRKGSDGRKRKN